MIMIAVVSFALTIVLGMTNAAVSAFVVPISFQTPPHRSTTRYYSNQPPNKKEDTATPLQLSEHDLQRFQTLQDNVSRNIPVLVIDAMVPGQVLTLRSTDATVLQLIQYCTSMPQADLCVLGIHPSTGAPLSFGVKCALQVVDWSRSSVTVALTATLRCQVRNVYHNTKNDHHHHRRPFSVADCDATTNDDESLLTRAEQRQAESIAARLEELLQEWDKQEHYTTSHKEARPLLLKEQKTIESYWTELAFYVTRRLNPVDTEQHVTMDIRPAMLCASNSLQRLLLATTALQAYLERGA